MEFLGDLTPVFIFLFLALAGAVGGGGGRAGGQTDRQCFARATGGGGLVFFFFFVYILYGETASENSPPTPTLPHPPNLRRHVSSLDFGDTHHFIRNSKEGKCKSRQHNTSSTLH